MIRRLLCIAALAMLLAGCQKPPAVPVNVHILPASNHGCEITCKDGLCVITCPFKYGCKPEGDALCIVENGEMRIRSACCPMYLAVHGCGCLKDGTYTGYLKDGVCTFRIQIR